MRNLFALRATDPHEMMAADDPMGDNYRSLLFAVAATVEGDGAVLAAWGVHGAHRDTDATFGLDLRRNWPESGVACLGYTKGRCPRHPLYVRADAVPVAYLGRRRPTGHVPAGTRVTLRLVGGGLAGQERSLNLDRIEQEPAAMVVRLALIDERYPSGIGHPVHGAHRHVETCGNLFCAHQSVLSLSHALHCTAVPYLRNTVLEWYNPRMLEWEIR